MVFLVVVLGTLTSDDEATEGGSEVRGQNHGTLSSVSAQTDRIDFGFWEKNKTPRHKHSYRARARERVCVCVCVCARGARLTADMDPIVLTEAQKADITFITQLEDDSAFPAAAPIFFLLSSFCKVCVGVVCCCCFFFPPTLSP